MNKDFFLKGLQDEHLIKTHIHIHTHTYTLSVHLFRNLQRGVLKFSTTLVNFSISTLLFVLCVTESTFVTVMSSCIMTLLLLLNVPLPL